jgi:polyisoprenoid-binding protein YceI
VTRHQIDPRSSTLWADARSSLHPIHVETNGFEGYLQAEISAGGVQIGLPLQVELDARLLKSGNGLLDGELQRRLETRKFPRVVGVGRELTAIAGSPGRYRIRGDLTLHGVTRTLETEITVGAFDGKLELQGEKEIDMRDFGLTPPKFLMLRVYPEVRVRVRLVASAQR